MRLRRSAVVASLAILIAGAASAVMTADAYRGILYPHGVPRRRSIETDRLETPSFHFVAAAQLPRSGRSVILYAEEIGAATADHEHFVFLALVDDGAKRVLDRVALNDLLPLRLNVPGEFLDRLCGRAPRCQARAEGVPQDVEPPGDR